MKAFLCLFALGIFLHMHEGQASLCPPGFESFYVGPESQDACLKFAMDVKRDWDTARSYCMSLGFDLAQLDEGNLHWSVISYIRSHPEMLNVGFHIGCTDEVNEGRWIWTDGRPVNMFSCHWYPGQPDGGNQENYGCLYYDDFMYNSCVNGERLYAICMF
ncbi:C-type lectin domain family 4 member F-like isoform X2 [Macrobrachium nipponense]|uniref:C-type lectin domain family 4 member F-like isoform X2 n=1 Tax=Macrobrachium nipponense TaxID=159736 RepID=UPI0030C8481D